MLYVTPYEIAAGAPACAPAPLIELLIAGADLAAGINNNIYYILVLLHLINYCILHLCIIGLLLYLIRIVTNSNYNIISHVEFQ